MKKILVINSGSATLKFKVYGHDSLAEASSGIVERIGITDSFIDYKIGGVKSTKKYPGGLADHAAAFAEVAKVIADDMSDVAFVGHRVVHGGSTLTKTTKVNAKSVAEAEKYSRLAPLHNPVNIAGVKAAVKLLPKAKQFMIFDTAYYRTLPECAYAYPLPEKYSKAGIRKYGFHGISHGYAAATGAKQAGIKLSKSKIITCHLGSGCSITATLNGQAVETSMGFTPLSGLMMSTRTGDMDPAVVLFMIRELGLSAEEVDKLLNKQSGLLGVAGTMDMREILFAAGKKVVGYAPNRKFTAAEKAAAARALEMFVYRVVKYIGEYYAVMKGVDLLVFTGGVGERSPAVRELVIKAVRHLGKFKTIVVPADEELMIASEVKASSGK